MIVTLAAEERRSGCLVGFWTQASISPLRFMVFISTLNHTHQLVRESTAAVVHLLDAEEEPLARHFGGTTGDNCDKFATCAWSPSLDGVPRLHGCARWFAGRILDRVPAGDHTGLLVEVSDAADGALRQLSRLALGDLVAGHPLTE